jgi:hypothetical protein
LLAYRRRDERRTFYVLLNLGSEPRSCELERGRAGTVVLSTALDRANERTGDRVDLRGAEGVIVRLD